MRIALIVAFACVSACGLAARAQNNAAAPARAPETAKLPRFEDDIRTFEAWDRKNSFPRNSVLFVGSSSIRLWPTAESFPDVPVINRGFGGSTIADVNRYAQRIVLKYEPQTIVFYAGDNDIAAGKSPQDVFDNFRTFFDSVHSRLPKTQIIYLPIKPSIARWPNWPQMQEANQLVKQLADSEPSLDYLDTATPMLGVDGQPSAELFLKDGLHMNETGYREWNDLLRPKLAALADVQTERDHFTLEPGYESLFNGHDLTGWGWRPSTEADIASSENWKKSDPNAPPWPIIKEAVSFEGKAASPDGRFVAENGRLIVTAPPEGRRIQKLHTTRQFPNDFVLRLEFRASPNADSGIYIREPQLQCRDYVLAGPYKNLKNYKPQDWNEIEVTVTGDVAHCTCNGEVLEAALKLPATGPIGVEGDRGQMEYRRIRIKELP